MQYASSFRIFRLIFSDNFRLLSKQYAQFLIRSVRIFHIKFRQTGCSDSINFRFIASQGNRLLQEKTSFLIINFLFQSWSKTFPNRWGLFSHKDLVFNEQSLLCKYTAKICPFNSVVWAAIVCISYGVLSVVGQLWFRAGRTKFSPTLFCLYAVDFGGSFRPEVEPDCASFERTCRSCINPFRFRL